MDNGVSALQEGAYLQASCFDRALQIDPDHAMSWARLGEAQLELDQERRAQQSVLHASSLVPDRAFPTISGSFWKRPWAWRTRHPAALRAYSTLAGRNQKSAPLLVDLGRVHEAMGAYPRRSRVIARPDSSMPRIPRLFCGWGFCMAGREIPLRRKPPSSVPRSSIQRAAASRGCECLPERGVMLDRADRSDEAVVALQRALQLATSVDSNYLRAAVLFKLSSVAGYKGRNDEAERHAREALRLGEEFDGLKSFGLVDLGNAFLYRKQLKPAEQHFREAVDISVRAGASRSEARARPRSAPSWCELAR